MNLDSILLSARHTLRDAMASIDRGAKGIALIVEKQRLLLGTLTDGDIRRAILAGKTLDTAIEVVLQEKSLSPYPRPVTAKEGASTSEMLQLMKEHSIRQLPLLSENGAVVDLVLLDDLLPTREMPLQAVIMAGGRGQRLRPLTDDLPKPMLPIGNRPLMELIVDQLREAGIRRVHVTTHYCPDRIARHFGNGSRFGVDIEYVNEEMPLGTAGALALLECGEDPLLVMNGDILTRVDFRAMLDFHCEHQADLTLGVRRFDMQVPYGVVDSSGPLVTGIREKPVQSFFVNAGIYLLEPEVHRYIPAGRRFDMTDLITTLIEQEREVVSFPIVEYWLDIGQQPDYEKALLDVASGRFLS